jgi:hypothetical protein
LLAFQTGVIRLDLDLPAGSMSKQGHGNKIFLKLSFVMMLQSHLTIYIPPPILTLMVTWYDSTNQKLPFLTNNYNLRTPDTWHVVSSGYNDSTNLSYPHPKVDFSANLQEGFNAWIAKRTDGTGIALFDSPSSTYTGMIQQQQPLGFCLTGAFPNPCNRETWISIDLPRQSNVTVELFDLMGRRISMINPNCQKGSARIRLDVSALVPGTYSYFICSDEIMTSGKLVVVL